MFEREVRLLGRVVGVRGAGRYGQCVNYQTNNTDHIQNIQATINAVLTQGAYGNAPSNIPVIDGQLSYFFGSPILVTYNTTFDFQYVLDFYRTEMPKYGWEDGNTTKVETSTSAKIPYQNADQRATISLSINPVNNETIVLINIISK